MKMSQMETIDDVFEPQENDTLKQLQAIQVLVDALIAQLSESEAPEQEQEEHPVAAIKKSLLASVGR